MVRKARQYGVRQRGDKWIARPYIPGVGHIWAGTFGSEDEALRGAMAAFDEHERLPANKETCEAFAARWIRDYPRPKASTNKHNAQVARAFGKHFGSKLLRDVQRIDARRWARDHLSYASTVRAMFTDAMDEGLVASNPFSNLRLPKSRGRKDIEVLSASELARLLEVAAECHPKYHFREFVCFAAYTGMRPSEINGLEWADIDFNRSEIHVRRQFRHGECSTPKNGRDRVIILPPPAAEALGALNRYKPVLATDERGVERKIDFVFRGKNGAPCTATTLNYYWSPVRAAFGQPDMDFYCLRHFCATYLLEKFRAAGEDGASDVAIQLGHTDDGSLVRDLYGHPDDDLARERLKRLFKENVEPLRPVEDDDAEATG